MVGEAGRPQTFDEPLTWRLLAKMHEQRSEQVQTRMEELKRQLPAKQQAELDRLVGVVRRYCRFREDGKYYLMRAYHLLRVTALEFGRRLGVGDGVFFLTCEEIVQALRCGFVPEDRIARRQKSYKAENRLCLPHVIDAEDIDSLGESSVPAQGGQSKGHPLSCGVTGPAESCMTRSRPGLGTGYVLVSVHRSFMDSVCPCGRSDPRRGGSLSGARGGTRDGSARGRPGWARHRCSRMARS
jgi:hypothetical protein